MLFCPKGNLISNGGFEEGAACEPPEDWMSTNTLTVGHNLAFTGCRAASLGEECPSAPAVLYQDVGVIPMHRYQLSFQLGADDCETGDLIVEVRWMDSSCNDLGPGLHVFASGKVSPDVDRGLWDAHVHLTECAPVCVCLARVVFTRSPRHCEDGPNLLDAVVLADVT